MDFYTTVHTIAKQQGLSLEKVSLKTGRTGTYISNARSRGSIPTISSASLIAGALDYKLCLVPADNIPDDAYVIE